MHCSVRQCRTRPDELDEILRLVDHEEEPWLTRPNRP